jgi:cytochrome P450
MNEDAAPRPRRTALRSLTAIDPYDTYRSAGEQSLVNWDDSLGGWTVLGFDECSAVLKDDSTFVMAWTTLEGGDAALGKYGIFNLTGEAHAQAHKELLDFFNPRKNLALRPAVRRVVQDSFQRIAGSDHVDFTHDIAQRVSGLMALAFLGVPQDESVLGLVHEANTKLQNYMQGFGDDPVALEELQTAQAQLQAMWTPTFEARRAQPRSDLVSKLLAMQSSLPDWQEEELASQCLFYFGASFGNTANTIANAAYVLATDEGLQQELREYPEQIPVFVDEVLRVWASVQFRIRIATRDTEIAGQPIRAGDRVILVVGAANRDERQFPDADRVDVKRTGSRRHLTFGVGSRYCVGATLARVEVEEILSALLGGDARISLAQPDGPAHFGGLNYRVWEPFLLRVSSGSAAKVPAT